MKEINTAYNMAYRGELEDVDLNTMIHTYDNGYYEVINPEYVKIENHYPELEFTLEDLQLQVPVDNNTWLQARFSPKNYHFVRNPYIETMSAQVELIPSYGQGIYNLPPLGRYTALPKEYKISNTQNVWTLYKNNRKDSEIKLELYFKKPYSDVFKNNKDTIPSIESLFNYHLSHIWIPYKRHRAMVEHFVPGGKKCITGVFEVLSDDDLVIQTFHRFPDESTWVRSYDYSTKKWTTWASEIPSFLHTNPEVQPKNFNPGYISYTPDTTYDSIERESVRFNDNDWQNRNTKKLHNDSFENDVDIDPNVEFEVVDVYGNDPKWTKRGKLKDLRKVERELANEVEAIMSTSLERFKNQSNYPGEVKFPVRDDFIRNGEKYTLKMGLANKYDDFNFHHTYEGTMEYEYFYQFINFMVSNAVYVKGKINQLINSYTEKTAAIRAGLETKLKKSDPRTGKIFNIVDNDLTTRKNFVIVETDNSAQRCEVEYWDGVKGHVTYPFFKIFKSNDKRIQTVFSNKLLYDKGRTEYNQSERMIRGISRPFVYVKGENKGHMIFHRGLALRCVYMAPEERAISGNYPREIGRNITQKVLIPRYYDLTEEPIRNPYPCEVVLRFKETINLDFYHDIVMIAGEYTNGRQFLPFQVLPMNDNNHFKYVSEKIVGVFIDYRRENDDFDSVTFYGTNYTHVATSRGLVMEVLVQE